MGDSTPTFRQRLEAFGLSCGAFVVRRFPFWWLRPVARILGTVVCLLDKRGREVGQANLAAAFQ